MGHADGARRPKWAWASTAVAVATTAIYVAVIAGEGNNPFWDVLPWAMLMVIATGAVLVSALTDDPSLGRFSATAGAVLLGALGVIAIFSVGVGRRRLPPIDSQVTLAAAGSASIRSHHSRTPTGSNRRERNLV